MAVAHEVGDAFVGDVGRRGRGAGGVAGDLAGDVSGDVATAVEALVAFDVASAVEALVAFDVASADRRAAESALASSARVRRWLDWVDIRLATRIAACAEADPRSKPAEDTIAASMRGSSLHARRVLRQARVVLRMPDLMAGLGQGDVSGEHVDAVHHTLARLPAKRRDEFASLHGPDIARAAVRMTVPDLRAHLERLIRDFDATDGRDRLGTQRRNVRLRTWIDRATGMVRVSGQYDPASGLVLNGRLQSTVDTLFRERVPDDCPDDPDARQDFLRAHALLALTEQPIGAPDARSAPSSDPSDPSAAEAAARRPDTGDQAAAQSGESANVGDGGDRGADVRDVGEVRDVGDGVSSERRGGRPRWRTEAVVIIDARTLTDGWHDWSHVDLGPGVHLPLDAIRRIVHTSTVVPVYTNADGVVVRVGDGRTPLDLGRTTRLANRVQRRALRAMHPTCGMPGCDVPFDHCQPHHVVWWRHGGRTDLANLLPLCSRHHHLVHDRGWELHLAPDRTVTARQPDGTTLVRDLARRWPR